MKYHHIEKQNKTKTEKKKEIADVGKDMEKLVSLYTLGGM